MSSAAWAGIMRRMTWLLKVILGLAVAYVAVVAIMYLAQTWMLFPTRLAELSATPLPANAQRLEVATPDGERLVGVLIPGSEKGDQEETDTILGFGGNAWNAESLAVYLREVFPGRDIVAFHYRGYRPSTGRPSAAALLADSLVIHDHLAETRDSVRITAVGISIGTGPAVYLAAHRPLAGLILVSPFDSLEALARQHYPWAPVGLLLRHRMPTIEFAGAIETPTAVVTAERDTIIPPRRSEALRRAIPNLVFDRTIAGAGHNDMFGLAEFLEAMRAAFDRIAAARAGDAVERR